MTWVRTDDAFPLHPKFFRAGVEAAGWWHGGLAYCNRNLTNGFIPTRDLLLVYPGTPPERVLAHVEVLVREVLLHPYTPQSAITCAHAWCAKFTAPVEGYVIHDYLDYQPSRAKEIKKRVAAKRRKDAWKKRKQADRGTRSERRSTRVRNAAGTPPEREGNARPVPVPDPVPAPVTTVSPTGDAAPPVAPAGKRATRRGGSTPHPVADETIREAVKAWIDLFTKYRGEAPVYDSSRDWPRFCAQIAPVVKRVGLEETRRLLERMFQSTHLKVTQSNYSIQFFAAEVNRWRGRGGTTGTNGGGPTVESVGATAQQAADAIRSDLARQGAPA